jgi:hypothetical protein
MSDRTETTSGFEDFSIDFAKFGLDDAFDPFMFPTVHLATPCENEKETMDDALVEIGGADAADSGDTESDEEEETFVISMGPTLQPAPRSFKTNTKATSRGRGNGYGIRSFKNRGSGSRWTASNRGKQTSETRLPILRTDLSGTGGVSTMIAKISAADAHPMVSKPNPSSILRKIETEIDESRRDLAFKANQMDPEDGRRVYRAYLELLQKYESARRAHDAPEAFAKNNRGEERHCDVEAWRDFGWDGEFRKSFEFEIRNVIYNVGCYEFAIFKKNISSDRKGSHEISLSNFKRKLASTFAIGYRKPDRIVFGDRKDDNADEFRCDPSDDRRFTDSERASLRAESIEFKRVAGIFDYVDRRCFFVSSKLRPDDPDPVCTPVRCRIYKYVGLISSMISSHIVASDSSNTKSITKSKFLLQHSDLIYRKATEWIVGALAVDLVPFSSLPFPPECTEVKGLGGMEKWEGVDLPQPIAWGFRSGPQKLQTWLRTLNVLRLIRYAECRFEEESAKNQKELASSEIASIYDLSSYYLYTERSVLCRLYAHVSECLRILSDYGKMNGSTTHGIDIKKFSLDPYLRTVTPKFEPSSFIPIPEPPVFYVPPSENRPSGIKPEDAIGGRSVYDLVVAIGAMHVKKHGLPEAWRNTKCGKIFNHLSDSEILSLVESLKID